MDKVAHASLVVGEVRGRRSRTGAVGDHGAGGWATRVNAGRSQQQHSNTGPAPVWGVAATSRPVAWGRSFWWRV